VLGLLDRGYEKKLKAAAELGYPTVLVPDLDRDELLAGVPLVTGPPVVFLEGQQEPLRRLPAHQRRLGLIGLRSMEHLLNHAIKRVDAGACAPARPWRVDDRADMGWLTLVFRFQARRARSGWTTRAWASRSCLGWWTPPTWALACTPSRSPRCRATRRSCLLAACLLCQGVARPDALAS
jgi:hypothetical protein